MAVDAAGALGAPERSGWAPQPYAAAAPAVSTARAVNGRNRRRGTRRGTGPICHVVPLDRVSRVVRLTKIYTRTGDGGETRLVDMSVTRKSDPRVEAYGDVDEANSAIGVALAAGGLPEEVHRALAVVQNELFDVGADLANPVHVTDPDRPDLRVTAAYVERLEGLCDHFGDPLPSLRSFILPGGSLAAAQLHVARTITRRAERATWAAVERHGTEPAADGHPGGVNLLAVTYLNRLSDLLFILTRVANGTAGDVLWVPGGERRHVERGEAEGGREPAHVDGNADDDAEVAPERS